MVRARLVPSLRVKRQILTPTSPCPGHPLALEQPAGDYLIGGRGGALVLWALPAAGQFHFLLESDVQGLIPEATVLPVRTAAKGDQD